MPNAETETGGLPQIDIAIEAGHWPDEARLSSMMARAIAASRGAAALEWPEDAELSLLFTGNEEMAEINKHWRKKDKATNVLSFPGDDVSIGEPAGIMIGDLVFAHETVMHEALEQKKPFENHLTHLMVHGFLHLFGYDHMSDEEASRMEALEIEILQKLGIPDPYA